MQTFFIANRLIVTKLLILLWYGGQLTEDIGLIHSSLDDKASTNESWCEHTTLLLHVSDSVARVVWCFDTRLRLVCRLCSVDNIC